MSRCKEDVIEMIDKAQGANFAGSICECHLLNGWGDSCNHCKIKEALQMSRSCIIASVDYVSMVRANMIEMQKEIETKLKTLLEED